MLVLYPLSSIVWADSYFELVWLRLSQQELSCVWHAVKEDEHTPIYLTRNGDLHMQTKVASVDSCELPLSLI